ncbi:hypothetical protein L1887_15255 [Cichorium endivia]|nr:hypothetical protein L1887_15255 [Cichorium endivia]
MMAAMLRSRGKLGPIYGTWKTRQFEAIEIEEDEELFLTSDEEAEEYMDDDDDDEDEDDEDDEDDNDSYGSED